MKRIGLLIAIILSAGCSEAPNQIMASKVSDVEYVEQQKAKNKYLTHSHSINATVDANSLAQLYKSLLTTCTNEDTSECIVMNSELSNGEYSYAKVALRVAPDGVAMYKKLISGTGKIEKQSTTAEDLTDMVADNEKKLEMLESYQSRLLELEQDPNTNIDSLIKLSSELAKVQTQLEYSRGTKAKLYQRIAMDQLNITLEAERESSFFGPIVVSLGYFGENLSEGLAEFIDSLAYLLPWILFLLGMIWLIRLMWKRGTK